MVLGHMDTGKIQVLIVPGNCKEFLSCSQSVSLLVDSLRYLKDQSTLKTKPQALNQHLGSYSYVNRPVSKLSNLLVSSGRGKEAEKMNMSDLGSRQ